jgi:glycosyltransferase involved in cell wall biosynthesis
MRLLIDNRWEDPYTGIGKVYENIMKNKPHDIEPFFVKPHKLNNPLSPLYLSNDIKKAQPDVFWSPSFIPPISHKIPYIFTIHDLIHLDYHSLFHKLYFKTVISQLGKKAYKIITVSEFTKNQIITRLGIPSQKVSVIYNGVDELFTTNNKRYILPNNSPYILYAGNRRKHKNLDRLLLAFAKANISSEIMLVLTGKCDAEITKKLKELNILERVHFTGYVSEDDMPTLYKGALCVAYVSLVEGFGLPILEAMASGTPILISNTSSLPEIAAGGALEINPYDINSIIVGLETIINDKLMVIDLIAIGNKRVKDFSWNDCQKKTWEIINNVQI